MCSAASSTDGGGGGGGGSDIFLITAQNINAGESHGGVIHGCSHNILFYVAMLTL